MGWPRAGAIAAIASTLAALAWGQEAPRPSVRPDAPLRGRVADGRDVYFAENNYTSTTLLHIRPDGTFAEYAREHMFVAITDEGRWAQPADGELVLCSHFRFKPIHAGDLTVYPKNEDIPRLRILAEAIEKLLKAQPGTAVFKAPDLTPVVLQSWLADDADQHLRSDALRPFVMVDDAGATRTDLESLVVAIRARIAHRNGSLVTHTVMRLASLTWLSDGEHAIENEMLELYRRHANGPFLPGMVAVAVDAKVFGELLGTRQSFLYYTEMNKAIPRQAPLEDFRGAPLDAPQCGTYGVLERPLPIPTKAPGVDMGMRHE